MRIDTELARAALRMAIEERRPSPGCIHHSDRGMQYAASEYVDDLNTAGLLISMSRKGNPYDNAWAESFMKTLKNEEVYLWDYKTFEDVKKRPVASRKNLFEMIIVASLKNLFQM